MTPLFLYQNRFCRKFFRDKNCHRAILYKCQQSTLYGRLSLIFLLILQIGGIVVFLL